MDCEIRVIPEAEKEFRKLDGAIKKQVAKKLEQLKTNPYLGKQLGNKKGVDLSEFYKIYIEKKKYRIVYKVINNTICIVQIWGIGKRDKNEIYNIISKRLGN